MLYWSKRKGVRCLEQQNIRRILLGLTAMVLIVMVLLGIAAGAKPEADDPALVTSPPPVANPYRVSDFAYNAQGYLTCTAGKSVLGIDVSEFQGWIDWEQVRESGIEFVMIRLGSRGYETGEIYPDEMAQKFYDGAKAAGLQVGAYFFSQAVSVEEAMEEADFTLKIIQNWDLDMPVVFDWEYVGSDARTGQMDARTLTDCTLAFCRMMDRAGYEPMVYFNLAQSQNLLYMEELTDFGWWLARYGEDMEFAYRVDLWQYTNKGAVPGVTGDVDINIWFPEE